MTTSSTKANDTLTELQNRAIGLAARIKDFKRPLVIEFTGTPKAGKTSSVDAIAKFFRRNKIPVSIVAERASVCPVSDKESIFFNVWTAATSLSHMISALEERKPIVVLDRGLFDSLAWMIFHLRQKNITKSEYEILESFFLLEKFTSRIDIVVCLSVNPEEAIEREFRDQITDKLGSIMNPETLKAYNAALLETLEKYEDNFRRIVPIDTSSTKPVDGISTIAHALLEAADEIVDEEIAVVPRQLIQRHLADGIVLEPARAETITQEILDTLAWERRSVAEEDPSLVQLVPILSVLCEEEILVIETRGSLHGRLDRKRAVWAGGHSRRADLPRRAQKTTLLRRTAIREAEEEIRLALELRDLPKIPTALIWDDTHERSAQHLGLLFEHNYPARQRSLLHEREYTEMASKTVFTRFVPRDEEVTNLDNLESWSALYLQHRFNLPLEWERRQRRIF